MKAPSTIVFLLFDGIQLLDLAGPADVFALASSLSGREAYRLHYIAPGGKQVHSSSLRVLGGGIEECPARIDTLVIPGGARAAIEAAAQDDAVLSWLDGSARRANRIVSICTGAFLLGRIGLLDGRRVATHWSAADDLARKVPAATVDCEALFVSDGPVWTSAGVAAGIDLALALVTRDMGPEIALQVARELVVHLVRPGGQSQFSQPLALQARARPDLDRLVPWISERLAAPITLVDMADAMGMTERTLQRRCVAQFGLPPSRLVAEVRLEQARMMLTDPAVPIALVAADIGFANQAALSNAFRARYGTSPTAYRRSFAAGPRATAT